MFKMGVGITTISRKLGIPKSTLHYWRHGIHKPATTRWTPKPSRELAYVIGVLLGDGDIVGHSRYDYDIELRVVDYEFAEEFSRNMAKLLNKKFKKPKWKKSDQRWKVYYRSKAFYMWFRSQSLETLKPYIEYSIETVKAFLKAIYNSEGNNYNCKTVSLSNTNTKLLEYIQELLRKYFSIVATGPYPNTRRDTIVKVGKRKGVVRKKCYEIGIYRKWCVRKFLREIGFSITTKQLGLPRSKMPCSKCLSKIFGKAKNPTPPPP